MCVIEKSPAHGTAIASHGRGLFVLGPSGSGKSGLALQLIALGADLVSDDQVMLTPQDGQILMSAPGPIAGQIEARGLGLLRVACTEVNLSMVVDLGSPSPARLPEPDRCRVLTQDYPLIRGADVPNLAFGLWVWLQHGGLYRNTSL
ncbi:MAG: serine kinase [Pseudomonadota bacterium]